MLAFIVTVTIIKAWLAIAQATNGDEKMIETTDKKRGRPIKADAMTAAERKRKSRGLAWDRFLNLENLDTLPTTAICEFLPRAVAGGLIHCAAEWSAEIVRRTKVNAQRNGCERSSE